jgi:ElaB/YqjD/DUF883 family membrane-anchored ribosome-binding protein
MKTGNLDSKFGTGTMSPTVRKRMTENRSEHRFLADQAADARTAMMQTVQEMKHTLVKAADVRPSVRQHPWIATGSAVAVGSFAGAVLSRPRSTSGNTIPAGTVSGASPASAAREPARAKTGFLRATLGTALTSLVQTLLQSLIAAAVATTEVDPVAAEPRHDLPPRPEIEPQMDTNTHARS